MPKIIKNPSFIPAAGQPPKTIREVVGRVNTKHEEVSVAHMTSPPGWEEPGQRPEFMEITYVIHGSIVVEVQRGAAVEVKSGQAIIAHPGEWIRYTTPKGADYISVCLPAFSTETVHREDDEE
ncbi:cupin [bacterium]|nr:cupin [bacterium]